MYIYAGGHYYAVSVAAGMGDEGAMGVVSDVGTSSGAEDGAVIDDTPAATVAVV